MKCEFLHREGSPRLILIFAGWSTGPGFYVGLHREGWDLAVVHDYADFEFDASLLHGYDTIWLFAWSLGVRAAEALPNNVRITSAVAVNGSPTPVSDEYGIPEAIYHGTADTLSADNLTRFRRRMMPGKDSFAEKFGNLPAATDEEINSLRQQLRHIAAAGPADTLRMPWRRVYVSECDRIFPPGNLRNIWAKHNVETITLPGAHHYTDLQQIIDTVLPDPSVVGRRFSRAADTYDHSATAQRTIAGKLMELICTQNITPSPHILEIGQGSGMLTRLLVSRLHPASCDFVDLYPTPRPDGTPGKSYVADAELWIEQCSESYDLIASASTAQWFADLPLFLRRCAKLLRPNGVLAFSTFLPGNLGELDTYRPSPIIYYTEAELRRMLEDTFSEVSVKADEIELPFADTRQMLMHIRATGVGGSAQAASPFALREINTLTYRPAYCICKK